MSLYLNQIAQLIALQKVDNAIYSIDEKLKKIPIEIDSLTKQYDDYTKQKANIEEKLSHLKEQEKRMLQEFSQSSSSMQKSQEKLEQVTNEREHEAAKKEIERIDLGVRTREDEQIVLQSEIELQESNLEEVTGLWVESEKKLAEVNEHLKEVSQESAIELEKLNQARQEALSHIPVPILSRYEFIRRRLKHPVIVPIRTGVCSGCHMTIPPQTYNELQKGQQIVSCPSCQRLVFWSEHFEEKKDTPDETSESENE